MYRLPIGVVLTTIDHVKSHYYFQFIDELNLFILLIVHKQIHVMENSTHMEHIRGNLQVNI